jgi:hypothetical protein
MKKFNFAFIFLFIVLYSPFLILGGLAYGVWAGLRGGWKIMENWIDDWPEE